MGEKTPLAILNASAAAKMAVAESIMNLASSQVERINQIRLSANWMASANHEGMGVDLYESVQAIGLSLCPDLGIAVPVGKDSMVLFRLMR